MMSKDKEMIQAFVDYAMDAEGMFFNIRVIPGKGYKATDDGRYDRQVVAAVKRNFKQDYGSFR